MPVASYVIFCVMLVGHVAMWIATFNRTHALNIPGKFIRITELAQILAAVAILLFLAERYYLLVPAGSLSLTSLLDDGWVGWYATSSLIFGTWGAGDWAYRQLVVQNPPQLVSNHSRMVDIGKQLEESPARGWSTRLFACLPMNQMFELCVNVKTIELPRLPAQLDGLTITHFSDLHFTGKVARPFFDRVIDEALAFGSDVIAITGDIQESERCYDWLPETLGRLRAPLGVYFVLGNHDRRLKQPSRLRDELTNLGMVDVAASTFILGHQGARLVFAGNELPWFRPAVQPPARKSKEIRILLSHSPDQLPWAQQHDIDLMLAGHTHGGHIRLPGFGPIVCPSRYGVRFASGTFFEGATLMHVSRGISGLDPLRFNCSPELTQLVLKSKA